VGCLARYGAEGLDWMTGMGQENVESFRAALAGDTALRTLLERAASWAAKCHTRRCGWPHREAAATPGKCLLGLRVRLPRKGDVGRQRTAARNALKVALPWALGHMAAFLLADPTASGSNGTGRHGIRGARLRPRHR
jgi:hypothetical protein